MEIPRAHRPRSGQPINPASVAFPTRESLQEFLPPAPFEDSAHHRQKHHVTESYVPDASTAMSLLGEPPTTTGEGSNADDSLPAPRPELDLESDQDLNSALQYIYAPVKDTSLESLIINTQIDSPNDLYFEGDLT